MDFTLYNKHLKDLMRWFFPETCPLCAQQLGNKDAQNTPYCSQCTASLPYLKHACLRCGQPFSHTAAYSDNTATGYALNQLNSDIDIDIGHEHTASSSVDHCGKCISHPPSFDHCFSPFEYSAPISDEICRLKYAEQPQLATRLAELFVDELLAHDIEQPEALLAVPMHSKRLRERGYNQSLELAKQIAKRLEIPLINDLVRKKTHTRKQTTKTLIQRQSNLKNSFAILKNKHYQHLAIVDDVITTGTTVGEISKILKKNGVDYIQVWSIARTR